MERLETASLCDAMHALGYKPTILAKEFKSNMPSTVVGRARTIRLKKKEHDDNPEQLHDGLRFMDTIKKDDFVIIADGFEAHAYWGELMSTVASRNGAVGAVIDGCTRDKHATIELGFPVFCKDWYGQDIRGYGIVQGVDCSVVISGVCISPGDLVCADGDGVLVIPRDKEDEILERYHEIRKNEANVKSLVRKNKKARELLDECGEF